MKRFFLFAVMLMLSLGAMAAKTPQFTANNLFVGGQASSTGYPAVFEYDPAGNLVQTIVVAEGSGYLYGVVFGPDGNLYVGDFINSIIYQITPELVITSVLSGADGVASPDGLSFGPDGKLYVCNRAADITTLDASGNVATIPVSFIPGAVTWGIGGRRYLTDGTEDLLHIQDLAGNDLATIEADAGYPTNAIELTDGRIYLASCNDSIDVIEADGSSKSTITIPNANCLYGMTLGPNGNLFSCDYSNDEIVELDYSLNVVRSFRSDDLNRPAYLAFAPYRFKTSLSGTLSSIETTSTKFRDAGIIISYSSGAPIAMMVATDPDNGKINYANLYGGSEWSVFQGMESILDSKGKSYLFHGTQGFVWPLTEGVCAMQLQFKGGPSKTSDYFFIKSAKVTLQRVTNNSQVILTGSARPIR